MQGLLAGDVEAAFAGSSALALALAGKFRILAVTQSKRMREFQDVPALAEYAPGFDITNWFGLFARQSIPPERLRAMRDHLSSLARDPELPSQLVERANITLEIVHGPAFESLIIRDHSRHLKTLERLGIRG